MRGALAAVWLALGLCAAGSAGAEESAARRAFAAQDYAAAEAIWKQDAAAGSAQAMLGLGTLADYGLDGPRDPKTAFSWYLKAARIGLAEAQLNVGVMLDGGVGTARDPDGALVWYSRAALRGNLRAQYNLGLMFESGSGTARDDALAGYWFAQAAPSLPAAAAKLASVRRTPEGRAAPVPAFAELGTDGVELVWRTTKDGAGPPFAVQVIRSSPDGEPTLWTARTDGSAILDALPGTDVPLFWRVSAVRDGGYVASDWQGLPAGTTPPKGMVRLGVANAELAATLRETGFWLLRGDGSTDTGNTASRVRYGFADDAPLARIVAAIVPGRSARDVVLDPDAGIAPGEVRVDPLGTTP